MPAPLRVSHVFLDVDGTLVEFSASLRAGLEAAAEVLSERAGRLIAPAVLNEARSRVFQRQRSRRPLPDLQEEAFLQVLRERGIEDLEAVHEANRRFFAARDAVMQPYDDVVPALEELRRLGFILTAATNGSAALMRTPVFALLHFTFSADEAGVAKPHPRFYQAALARAGASPRTSVMVGDRIDNDLEPAQSLGMHAVLIDRAGKASDPGYPVVRSLLDLPALLAHAGPGTTAT